MSPSLDIRRSLALTAALVVASWGAVAVPAAADHVDAGNGKGKAVGHAKHASKSESSQKGRDRAAEAGSGSAGKGQGQGKPKGSPAPSAAGKASGSQSAGKPKPSRNQGSGNQGSGSQSSGSADQGAGTAGEGDPLGNNGTVKVAPYGEVDGIPNNTPHPGCSFQIEWYGFDEGEDVVSVVTFAMQAPTQDAQLTVGGPREVFVGEDPATGAGTDTGLDAVQPYTLSFDGTPHAKQGYHVKLTIETPHSLGADRKSKVFWVEACEGSGTANPTGDEVTEDTDVLGVQATGDKDPGTADDTEVLGVQAEAGTGQDVAAADAAAADVAADDAAAVPTAVDAGDDNPVLRLVTSPWGWAFVLVGLGALLSLGAVATRRASVRAHG